MELRILGCNGPYPCPGGACSGYLVHDGQDTLLMDMGAGVFSRLISYFDPAELNAICLSHWHWDHCSDLGVLCYYLGKQASRKDFTPIPLHAPKDDTSPMAAFISTTGLFDIRHVSAGDSFMAGNMNIQAGPARHPIAAVSYRIGDHLLYTGDTNTVKGLASFAKGIHTLLACGCITDSMWTEESPQLSASHAAALAAEAEASRLLLTHLRPDVDEATLLREARTILPDAQRVKENLRFTFP